MDRNASAAYSTFLISNSLRAMSDIVFDWQCNAQTSVPPYEFIYIRYRGLRNVNCYILF